MATKPKTALTTPAADTVTPPTAARLVPHPDAEDDAPATCSEFSVSFALLTTDNKRQISFGVTRGCIDAHTPLYVISFLLRDKVGDEFQDRVKLLVTIGPESNDKAQAIIDRGLRSSQKGFLEGPITTRAKIAPKGTTESTPAGAAIATELTQVFTK
jgi:hypothetical protein